MGHLEVCVYVNGYLDVTYGPRYCRKACIAYRQCIAQG